MMSSAIDRKCLQMLASLRESVRWKRYDARYNFIRQVTAVVHTLYPGYTPGQLPALWNIFRREEIESLLLDSARSGEDGWAFVMLLADSGYKHRPVVDERGEPISRRATPIHELVQHRYRYATLQNMIPDLFQIYGYDVNYVDEGGLTHFHAACLSGRVEIVEEFLERGYDPDCAMEKTGDRPLHLAAQRMHKSVAELLLSRGANPTLANAKGSTPLHVFGDDGVNEEIAKMICDACDEKHLPVQVDARDENGDTPLHVALKWQRTERLISWLLRRSADLNLTDGQGCTPLHLICMRNVDQADSARTFFRISDERNQIVLVDAKDDKGRTPLQWAVAQLMPNTIDVLLDRGADLSSFVFPSRMKYRDEETSLLMVREADNYMLKLASGALAVVERLEKRGYEIGRVEATTIMRHFADYFFDWHWFMGRQGWRGDEEFVSRAKEITVIPNLSFYDLMRLSPEEAEKRVTYMNYYEFRNPDDRCRILMRHYHDCIALLCEKLSRGFFRRWTLDPFAELIHRRLSIKTCEKILGYLSNKDLYHICLAAADQK